MGSSTANKAARIQKLPPLEELVGKKFVTLSQLSRLLGVTYQTVLRYKNQGKIHAVKVGGTWRVYEEELRRFLDAGNLNE